MPLCLPERSIRNGSQSLVRPDLFALIACQRSGTHLLREIINSNPGIALFSEPFTPDPNPVYWSTYIRTLSAHEYPPLLPEDAMDLLDRYMLRVQQDLDVENMWSGGGKPQLRTLGLDVKYNQIKCVNPVSSNLRTQPLLLDYFRSRDFRIIHMVRKNLVHAALSLIIAKLRNVWGNEDGAVIQGRYEISTESLFSHIWSIKSERDEFVRLAHDLPMQTCVYEDLVKDIRRVDAAGEFPNDTIVLAPLARYLDVPNRFKHAPNRHKVINRPFAEILENYDELVRAIEDSEFSEFADTI